MLCGDGASTDPLLQNAQPDEGDGLLPENACRRPDLRPGPWALHPGVAALQGRWRCQDVRAVVTGAKVHFSSDGGAPLAAAWVETKGLKVVLLGAEVLKRSEHEVQWSDGDVWHAEKRTLTESCRPLSLGPAAAVPPQLGQPDPPEAPAAPSWRRHSLGPVAAAPPLRQSRAASRQPTVSPASPADISGLPPISSRPNEPDALSAGAARAGQSFRERCLRVLCRWCCCCCGCRGSDGAGYVDLLRYVKRKRMNPRRRYLVDSPRSRELVRCLRPMLVSYLSSGPCPEDEAKQLAMCSCVALDTPDLPPGHRFDILMHACQFAEGGKAAAAPFEESGFVRVLKDLRKRYWKEAPPVYEGNSHVQLLRLWLEADRDASGTLDPEEMRSMLARLHVPMSESEFQQQFEIFDTNADSVLDLREFGRFYHQLRRHDGLKDLWTALGGSMTPASLLIFWQSMQGQLNAERHEAEAVMKAWSWGGCGRWDLADFSVYLFSEANSWWRPDTLTVHQDMTRPLNEYYINCSHNTYLTGDQLASSSHELMYSYCLDRGCRCVEIDCWDGGDGDPQVTHGGTATSAIRFGTVIEEISRSAFAQSPYPVILSLENHTTWGQQAKMAEYIERYLGDALLLPPAEGSDGELPSPESLKGRFIVRTAVPKVVAPRSEDLGSPELGDTMLDCIKSPSIRSPKLKKELHPALRRLVYLNSVKPSDSPLLPRDCPSMSEVELHRFPSEWLRQLVCRHLVRVYPKGQRVFSENPDPLRGWADGVQLLAINFQCPDTSHRLNRAMFLYNGNCGYVLKSPPSKTRTQLTVTVVGAACLRDTQDALQEQPVLSPRVECHIAGAKDDSTRQPRRTQVVRANGFNPVWNESFSFTLADANIALLSLRVVNAARGNDFVAEATCPVRALRTGYRSVQLYDKEGERIRGSSLACRFCADPV